MNIKNLIPILLKKIKIINNKYFKEIHLYFKDVKIKTNQWINLI